MESYEKLKNLPDAEKAKYFEAFIESIELASDDSDNPEKDTHIRAILDNLTGGNFSDGNSRKKQKTLDSWLLKPKNSSPHKNKIGESSCSLEEPTEPFEKPTEQRLNSDTNKVSNLTPNYLDSTSCPLEEPIHQRLYSDKASECLTASNQTTISNIGDVNSFTTSKNNEIISKSSNHSPLTHEQGKILDNNCVKIVHISPNNVQSTETYNLRPKRKCTRSPQHSKLKKPSKSQLKVDDSSSNRCNREITQSEATNNHSVNHDISPKSIVVVNNCNTNIAKKIDSLQVDNLQTPLDKTNNLRPKKSSLQDSVTRDTKLSNVLKDNDLEVSNYTESKENDNQGTTNSSLSNCEAFHILEAECSHIGLNILNILQDENIQKVLNNQEKLSDEALILINSFKSNNGEFLPVVHLVESKKKLSEMLNKFNKNA